MTALLLASADELRDYLDVPYGELDDARAELLLAGVSGVVLGYCNRETFGTVTSTFLLDGSGSNVLLLPGLPVTAVGPIVEDPRGAAVELVEDVDFEWSANGILTRLPSPTTGLGAVWRRRARWYATPASIGYTSTPQAVKAVVLRLAARAVGNPEGLTMENAEGYRAGFSIDDSRLPTCSAADRRDLNPFRLEA